MRVFVFILIFGSLCGGLHSQTIENLLFNDSLLTVSDVDGNTYHMIQIGKQVWMKENLKTTRFNDSTAIPLIRDNAVWSKLTSPGYCWYNNDEIKYKDPYGALYNRYAVNTGKLCPVGWHVPTEDDWYALFAYLGSFASGKLKEAGTDHWTPNGSATNRTSFTALPAGYRDDHGIFSGLRTQAMFWSNITGDIDYNWYKFLSLNDNIVLGNSARNYGLSVRCIRD